MPMSAQGDLLIQSCSRCYREKGFSLRLKQEGETWVCPRDAGHCFRIANGRLYELNGKHAAEAEHEPNGKHAPAAQHELHHKHELDAQHEPNGKHTPHGKRE